MKFKYLGITLAIMFLFQVSYSPGFFLFKVHKKDTLNVLKFGAKGDGKTDNTKAFQKALDTAAKDNGGRTVYVPKGNYIFKGHLNIPENVTLEGVWQIPTSWTQYKGTTLLPTESENTADGPPFITLWTNSVIKGITIFYPNQTPTNPPKPYPWTIQSGGSDNSSIIDVLIVNPYMAVDFGTHPAGRHYIRNLYAQPLLKGLYVDQCYDIGRVENVHFWPFWNCNNPQMAALQTFINEHGEAFIFGRTDWEYVYNTFSWGYKVGYHFIKTKSGTANGNFSGIGADATNNAILVDDCAPYGLLITNGEFVSFLDPNPTSIVIDSTNQGVIQLQNCAFWGPANQIASIKGKGTVMFNNCNFVFWSSKDKKAAAIEAYDGNLIVTSSNFNLPGNHIKLHPEVKSAVVTGNRFAGIPKIDNQSQGVVQIGLNAGARLPKEEPNAIIIDDQDDPPAFRTEGEWFDGVGGQDYLELTKWAPVGKGDSKAFWTPIIPESGFYKVYLWYGADPYDNHATNQPYTIKYKNGEKTFSINLRQNIGIWNLLGTFEFDKGTTGYVMATNKADNNVNADAVKFVPTLQTAK
jgi:hypothetical protein